MRWKNTFKLGFKLGFIYIRVSLWLNVGHGALPFIDRACGNAEVWEACFRQSSVQMNCRHLWTVTLSAAFIFQPRKRNRRVIYSLQLYLKTPLLIGRCCCRWITIFVPTFLCLMQCFLWLQPVNKADFIIPVEIEGTIYQVRSSLTV